MKNKKIGILFLTTILVLVMAGAVTATCNFSRTDILTYPNGDEFVEGTISITWDTSVCDGGESITLKYKLGACSDNFEDYTNDIASDTANDGSQPWDTSGINSNACILIKQSGFDPFDRSDSEFTVDNTDPSAPTNVLMTDPINDANQDSVNVTGDATGEDNSTANCTVTDGSNSVTETGTVSSDSFDITLDVSSLDDGELNATCYIIDQAGNEGPTDTDNATKDAELPTASNLTITHNLINNDNETDTFIVTIDYSETMDTTEPTIEFDPTVSSTLTGCSGNWTDADTYEYNCTIADDDEEVDDVDINVSGAEDLVGNTQTAHTEINAFDIDMKDPIILNATASPNPAKAGTVTITIVFNETMDNTTSPSVNVTGLTTDPYSVTESTYSGTTWTGTFTLLDENEDATATISVSGATDAAGNTMDANNSAGTFDVDTIDPAVTSINTTKSDGTYTVGETIDIVVVYDDSVEVTGTPKIALNSAGFATYNSGNGTTNLTFRYTVVDGENSADLTYNATSSLDLNGGTIKDAAGNDANNTLPDPSGFSGAHAIVIDTDEPIVSSIDTDKANGTYTINETINITVVYNESVLVTGTPKIALNSGGFADYSGGNGTTNLTFTYTVADGENSADLTYNATDSLSGGTIRDAAGNDANNTLPPNFLTAHNIVIDTVNPTGNVTVDTNPIYEGDLVLVVNITYNETMDNSSTPTISFAGNQSDITTQGDGAWDATNITWTETFNVTEGDEESNVNVTSSGAKDIAGNTEGTSNQGSFEIDTLRPDVVNATVDQDPAKAGTRIITVVFNETMDNATDPTIQITGLTSSPYSVDTLTYNGTTWTGNFTLEDDDEDTTATINVSGAKDAAGNTMDANATAGTFEVDTATSSQSTSVEVSPNPVEIGEELLVTAYLQDPDGVASAKWYIYNSTNDHVQNGSMNGTFGQTDIVANATINTTGYDAGNYKIVVLATDGAGNEEEESLDNSETFTVQSEVDDIPPSFYGITFDKAEYERTNDPNVTISISEDGTAAIVMVDGNNATNTGGANWTYTFAHPASVGTYTVSISAYDAEGNENNQELTYLVVEDGEDGSSLADRIDSLNNTIVNTITPRINTVNATAETNEDNIANLTSRVNTLEGDVTTLQTNVSQLRNDTNELQGNVSTLRTDVDNLEDDVDDLFDDISDLEGNDTILLARINAVNGSLQTESGRIDSLNTTVGNQQTSITNIENKLNAYINFKITDTTDDIWSGGMGILNITTNYEAVCTYTNELNNSVTGAMTSADNLTHAKSINNAYGGLNIYSVECTENEYNFSKEKIIFFYTGGLILIPQTGEWTADWNDFWLSSTILDKANVTNHSVSNILSSPSIDGKYDIVWQYDWDETDPLNAWKFHQEGNASSQWDEFDASLGYYWIHLTDKPARIIIT